jgi:8-oxo-dGTP diphosphatase
MAAGEASEACAFCALEPIEPLLVGESAGFSLASAPEPLVEGHLVLIPRSHLADVALLPEPLELEKQAWRARIEQFLRVEFGAAAFYEPTPGHTHAVLHAGPGPLSALIEAAGAAPQLDGEFRPTAEALAVAGRVRLRWQRHRSVVVDEPIELVACLLRRAGRICLFKRSPRLESAPDRWHAVSGYLPDGVDPLGHALLEVEQETGLTTSQVQLVRSAEPILLQRPDDVRRWRVHAYLLDVLAGEQRLNWEHVDLRWVVPSDLPGLRTIPWLGLLLDGLLGHEWRSGRGDFSA